jgi:hypothetical protein
VAKHPSVRFYWLSEQTDPTLAPYLQRWGIANARNLHLVTREKADALWRAHDYVTQATWDYLGPMVLDDAGRRGTDVFVMDTWTAWSGAQDKDGIQRDMAPIREAVGRWGYGAFVLGHTNKDGELLGSKEFERLCDVSFGGEVVPSTPVRRLWWVKDRSPNKYPDGHQMFLVRDLTGPMPCYRETGPDGLSALATPATTPTTTSGGVGGVTRNKVVDLVDEKHPVARRLRRAGGEGCTVADLTLASGLTQQAVSLWLKTREREGHAERFAKRGAADVWRLSGTVRNGGGDGAGAGAGGVGA